MRLAPVGLAVQAISCYQVLRSVELHHPVAGNFLWGAFLMREISCGKPFTTKVYTYNPNVSSPWAKIPSPQGLQRRARA